MDTSKLIPGVYLPDLPGIIKTLFDGIDADGFPNFTFTFEVTGNLSTGVNKTPVRIAMLDTAKTYTLVRARAYCKTAPATQAVIVDINKNAVTIFTAQGNRPQVGVGANLGAVTTPAVTTLADGDIMTLDIDQVGVGTVGADLTVVLQYKVDLFL